ncbi:unnamed protein product [Mycena citricolor]|uniref:Calcineurin-like phosphoesterase domain-containing protein n=1 Tax=Mycena citricolor TaxID=2018698 RepID=A0AAD2HH52_9AGAR|nr:unnamed protein product [Mycena citricolor]
MRSSAGLVAVLFCVAHASVIQQTPLRAPAESSYLANIPIPTRPLEWGDINIISTTDTHGWLLGHQKKSFPEPSYSGTWGDYYSFVEHMKGLAEEKDVDLLLVDSGDLHDGTGLTDGFPAGGVDARDSNEFFKQMPYDVLAIGNHELYTYANTLDMHTNFAKHFGERYLSSNVNITIFDANNQTVSVPVGNRYRKFKTRKGRRVTSFGVLFDFEGNDMNTTVQKVESMVQESWFLQAIQEEPDLFLLVGHMPAQNDVSKWPLVSSAIRKVHPTTPIMIFGGHLHIRDCMQLDDYSMSIASGRYMETLGWMSVRLDVSKPIFNRRYLDPNVNTYMYHSGRTLDDFETPKGRDITAGLNELADRFGLTHVFGSAPQDYTLSRAPYPSNASLQTLIVEEVVPTVLTMNSDRSGLPFLFINSGGSQRFDILQGPFTSNDQFTATPFVNQYLFIPNIPFSVAMKLTPAMNAAGAERFWDAEDTMWATELNVERQYVRSLMAGARLQSEEEELTLGYVTSDSCPGDGDDIKHTPVPVYPFPDFVESVAPVVSDPDAPIDLIFVDFIRAQLIRTLNEVQNERVYSMKDAGIYSPVRTNEVLGIYASALWNTDTS